MFCAFVAGRRIALCWIILKQNCKNLVDLCTRENFRFIIYLRSLNLKAGLASLGSRWRNQVPLNLSCGPMYGVVLCYPRWCMAHWLAVTVEGLDLMTTCSVCREEYDDNLSCPVCACFFRAHGQPVPRVLPCSWRRHASMLRSFSWL